MTTTPMCIHNRSVDYKDNLLVACGCFHHVEDFICGVSEVISVDYGVIKAPHGWQYDTGKGKDQTYQVIVKRRHLANSHVLKKRIERGIKISPTLVDSNR